MKKHAPLCTALLLFAFATVSAFAGVTISSPSNNSTTSTSVNFVANGSTSCSKGVASMGIYPAPNQLEYVGNGASLNTSLNLTAGSYKAVIVEWDYCGGSSTATVAFTVKTGQSGVFITSPASNSTVSGNTNFVATATTTCSSGVATMGIYPAPSQLDYVGNGASLNTSLALSSGTYNAVVVEWDKCGGSASAAVKFSVSSSGKVMSNLQNSGGWQGYAQQPPS